MRALVFLASLVIAGPSFAQTLLVEMRDADMFCGNCPPNNITIALDGSFSTGGVTWLQPVTTNDVGATFTMPSSLLDDFAAGLTSGTTGLGLTMLIHNAGVGGRVNSNDITYGVQLNNPEVIRHAPGRGRNLIGYTVSSITHTLNGLSVTEVSSNRYNLSGTSTVRIYGTAIPPLAGDYNINGTVDAADYVAWRKAVPIFDPMPNGTGQGLFEGRALPDDYAYWRANFGRTVLNGLGATAVPEPCTLFLVLILAIHPLRLRHSLRYCGPLPLRA